MEGIFSFISFLSSRIIYVVKLSFPSWFKAPQNMFSSIPAILKHPRTISVISSTSIVPPPSWTIYLLSLYTDHMITYINVQRVYIRKPTFEYPNKQKTLTENKLWKFSTINVKTWSNAVKIQFSFSSAVFTVLTDFTFKGLLVLVKQVLEGFYEVNVFCE